MTNAVFLSLLSAICTVESGNTPNAIHIDDGGSSSLGMCQIKYTTAKEMGFKGHISELWLNPEINKFYAGRYLRKQLRRYRGNIKKAVAAYNAGSVKHGIIKNTLYVTRVMNTWGELQ